LGTDPNVTKAEWPKNDGIGDRALLALLNGSGSGAFSSPCRPFGQMANPTLK
jgi:hypothetical protein